MPHAPAVHLLFRRNCCRGLLVRVEKLLGDLKRAELAVPSEDSVVLGMDISQAYFQSRAVYLGWKNIHIVVWAGAQNAPEWAGARGGPGQDGAERPQGHGRGVVAPARPFC